MNKNDVIEAFNQACIGLSAFMDQCLENEFPEGETIVTIPFIETQMLNVDDTWWNDDNIVDARNYHDALSEEVRLELTKMGIEMIGQNREHRKQFETIRARNSAKELIYLTPHMVNYSSDLLDTNGYETLSTVCQTMQNIHVSPWLVVNPNTDDLRAAFMLSVRMQSIDNKSLRDKIINARDAGLFESVRQHYGLS